MLAVLALREVTVHHGDRVALGVAEGAPDEAPLGFLAVAREAAMQFQGRLAGEQGDAVVAFLPVVVDVVAERLDLGLGKLVVGDLGFLQPDHVGLVPLDQRRQLVRPGAQTVDIERDDFHGGRPGKNRNASPAGGCLATLEALC